MSGFKRNRELVAAEAAGQSWFSSFRKVPAIATAQGHWADLSMSPGNPKPNYYVGAELTSTALASSTGIWTGGNVSPCTKHLLTIGAASTGAGTPCTLTLCDYLLFYPLIDMDVTDEQNFENTIPLPRYTDGLGVQAMLIATNPYIGGQTFSINYTNHLGVSGQISRPVVTNTITFIGTTLNSAMGPFIPLADPREGIRSAQSITFTGPNGGLAALVLVKPIATLLIREITAWTEHDFVVNKLDAPRIVDGAYLNFICNPNGSLAAVPVIGYLQTIWN